MKLFFNLICWTLINLVADKTFSFVFSKILITWGGIFWASGQITCRSSMNMFNFITSIQRKLLLVLMFILLTVIFSELIQDTFTNAQKIIIRPFIRHTAGAEQYAIIGSFVFAREISKRSKANVILDFTPDMLLNFNITKAFTSEVTKSFNKPYSYTCWVIIAMATKERCQNIFWWYNLEYISSMHWWCFEIQ